MQLGIATPDRIENDFMDLEAAFNSAVEDPNGHFASEKDITLKEVDQLKGSNQLQDFDMVIIFQNNVLFHRSFHLKMIFYV